MIRVPGTVLAWMLSAAMVAVGAQAAGQPLPRTPDGTPDLSGVWQVLNSAAFDI